MENNSEKIINDLINIFDDNNLPDGDIKESLKKLKEITKNQG